MGGVTQPCSSASPRELTVVLAALVLALLALDRHFAGGPTQETVLDGLGAASLPFHKRTAAQVTLMPVLSGGFGRQVAELRSAVRLARDGAGDGIALWLPPFVPRAMSDGRQRRQRLMPSQRLWNMSALLDGVTLAPQQPRCGAAGEQRLRAIIVPTEQASEPSLVHRTRWILKVSDSGVRVSDGLPVEVLPPIQRDRSGAFFADLRQKYGLRADAEVCVAVSNPDEFVRRETKSRDGDSIDMRPNDEVIAFVDERYDVRNLLVVYINFDEKGCCRGGKARDHMLCDPLRPGVCLERVDAKGLFFFESQDTFRAYVSDLIDASNSTQVYFVFSPLVPNPIREHLLGGLPSVPTIATLSQELTEIVSRQHDAAIGDGARSTGFVESTFADLDLSTQSQFLDEYEDLVEFHLAASANVFVGVSHCDWSKSVRRARTEKRKPSLLAVTSLGASQVQLKQEIATQIGGYDKDGYGAATER